MKTKKCGAYAALAAVLLISAVLITNCIDPINPGGLFVPKDKDKDQPAFVPPPGMGYVMLNFGAGRTIRPAAGDFAADAEAFIHFDVIFTPDTSATPPGTTSNGSANAIGVDYEALTENPFVLGNGGYIVEVYAFDVAHQPPAQPEDPPVPDLEKAVAYGFASLVVVAGEGEPVTITLSSITSSSRASTLGTFEGTGTFTLDLTNAEAASPPSTYIIPAEKITMTITEYPISNPPTHVVNNVTIYDPTVLVPVPESDPPETIPLNILGSYSTSLPPGFYLVTLTLSGNSRMASKTITEILYIYHGMTSTYLATLPALGRNVYDVNFTYGDSRTTDGTSITGSAATETVNHGATLGEPGAPYNRYVTGYDDDDPEYDDTWVIESWHTSPTFTSTNKWTFTSRFLRDAHLYAQWKKTGVYVTVSYDPPTENEPDLSIYDQTNSTTLTGTSIISIINKPILVVSFVNTGNVYTNIEWYIDDVLQSSTTASLTINLALEENEDLLVAGPHVITVRANHPDSPTKESNSITFTIGQ